MFSLDEQESPASSMVKTEAGYDIDVNNIPGKRKTQMIMDGELTIDEFNTPPNMPGKKLKALRDAANEKHDKNVEAVSKRKKDSSKDNPYQLGDMVKYGNTSSEVKECDPKRGVKIIKADGSLSKWIHFNSGKLKRHEENE